MDDASPGHETIVITLFTYSDWEVEGDEVVVNSEDEESVSLGTASLPDEAARLVTAYISSRPSALEDQDDPEAAPVSHILLEGVRAGRLGLPLWRAAVHDGWDEAQVLEEILRRRSEAMAGSEDPLEALKRTSGCSVEVVLSPEDAPRRVTLRMSPSEQAVRDGALARHPDLTELADTAFRKAAGVIAGRTGLPVDLEDAGGRYLYTLSGDPR